MERYEMTPEQHAVLTRAAEIKQAIKDMEADYALLMERMDDLPAGEYFSDDLILKMYPTTRFDEATAKRSLSAAKFKTICKMKPDSALAKAVLTDEDYAKCQKVSGMTKRLETVESDN